MNSSVNEISNALGVNALSQALVGAMNVSRTPTRTSTELASVKLIGDMVIT